MCKAFSCLVTRGNKVYWKAGLDSHEDLRHGHASVEQCLVRERVERPRRPGDQQNGVAEHVFRASEIAQRAPAGENDHDAHDGEQNPQHLPAAGALFQHKPGQKDEPHDLNLHDETRRRSGGVLKADVV